MQDVSQQLVQLLGPAGWLPGAELARRGRDWLDRYGEPALGLARPASTQEVSALVKACRAAGVSLTPQGGNTSLCGASVPGQAGAVLVSLERMNQIGAPDPDSGAIQVEAGAILAALHAALEPHGLIFSLHLGAEGSAQIGGLIGTNAGGSHAARYGMMQDLVLGLEVVLADGSVWDGLRWVQKDNAGYQLRRLFCGAEGSLGIVTRAVLKLYPEPKARATALLALPSLEAVVAFGTHLRAEARELISGLEFFPELGLALAEKHVAGLDYPLASRAPWYLLVELEAGSPLIPVDALLEAALEYGMEQGWIVDGTLAASQGQRDALWRLREEQPEGQRLEAPQLKHDISLPPGRLAAFVEQASAVVQAMLPGARINPFGHLGDGNVHYNLTPPVGQADFAGLAGDFALRLGALAQDMGGSFAAEHGLGRAKIAMADALRSPVERDLMRTIKSALDPRGLLNPGVILTSRPEEEAAPLPIL
jgi:FAD/FMN-containing dehydrogenase